MRRMKMIPTEMEIRKGNLILDLVSDLLESIEFKDFKTENEEELFNSWNEIENGEIHCLKNFLRQKSNWNDLEIETLKELSNF